MVIPYKLVKRVLLWGYGLYAAVATWVKLKGNDVHYGKGLRSNGVPFVDVEMGGRVEIGRNFRMNNGRYYNKIGRQQPCMLVVSKGALLEIGDGVAMSATTIVCRYAVRIGHHVKIGGNCVLYDSDFHSLYSEIRRDVVADREQANSAAVVIGNDVFIGAHSTILKGVQVGDGAVIGACSVVRKSIPAGEIWAGNPAVKIGVVMPGVLPALLEIH